MVKHHPSKDKVAGILLLIAGALIIVLAPFRMLMPADTTHMAFNVVRAIAYVAAAILIYYGATLFLKK